MIFDSWEMHHIWPTWHPDFSGFVLMLTNLDNSLKAWIHFFLKCDFTTKIETWAIFMKKQWASHRCPAIKSIWRTNWNSKRNWIDAAIISTIISIISIQALLKYKLKFNWIPINFSVFRLIKSQWLHDREKRRRKKRARKQIISKTELTFVMAMSLPSSKISILNSKIEQCITISIPMHYKLWIRKICAFDFGKSNGKSLTIPINQHVVSYSNNVQCTMQMTQKLKAYDHKYNAYHDPSCYMTTIQMFRKTKTLAILRINQFDKIVSLWSEMQIWRWTDQRTKIELHKWRPDQQWRMKPDFAVPLWFTECTFAFISIWGTSHKDNVNLDLCAEPRFSIYILFKRKHISYSM